VRHYLEKILPQPKKKGVGEAALVRWLKV
jgi:hypothetical protein